MIKILTKALQFILHFLMQEKSRKNSTSTVHKTNINQEKQMLENGSLHLKKCLDYHKIQKAKHKYHL